MKKNTQKYDNSIATLRSNLIFGHDDEKKILSFCGVESEQSIAKIASDLLESMKYLNKRLLLVDSNLINSDSYFASENFGHGLFDILKNQKNLEDVLIKDFKSKGYDFIPSGDKVKNSSELLSEKRFHDLVEELKADYDFVIFLTPDLKEFIDGALVTKFTDGALIFASEDMTNKDHYIDAIKSIENVNANIIGSVFLSFH